MSFYILLTILVFFLCLNRRFLSIEKNRINVSAIAFLLISIISLLRFDVGWDYVNYYQAVASKDIYLINRFEPLSQLFFSIAIALDSPHLIFLLFGVPTYLLIYNTISKYSNNIGFSVFLYFCFFYLESLGFIRQALAVSICFWAIRYIYSRKFLSYFICVLIAFLFHYSSIIALIAYFFYPKVKLVYLIWYLPILFLLREIVFYLLGMIGIYTSYLNELFVMKGGALIRFFYILLFISLLILGDKKKIKENNYLLFMIGLALSFPFLLGSHLGVRLSSYFFLYYVLIIPKIITVARVKFFYMCIATLFFLTTLYLTVHDPNKSQYVPYQFIFEIDKPVFRETK